MNVTYYDLAENDYVFFKEAYNVGIRYLGMLGLAEDCCCKYLKHLIACYAKDEDVKEHTLDDFTNNVDGLLDCVHDFAGIFISISDRKVIRAVQDYRKIISRIPFDMDTDSSQVDECLHAIEVCKNLVDDAIEKFSSKEVEVKINVNRSVNDLLKDAEG